MRAKEKTQAESASYAGLLLAAGIFALLPAAASWFTPYGSLPRFFAAGLAGTVNLLLFVYLIRQMRRTRRFEDLSLRDPLTHLFNRSFMEIALERELRRAARQQSTLAVFMIDVDHFKSFNDTFGHAAGDTVLREIAGVFGAAIRSDDIVCRYGGEEFVVILPEIPRSIARERAEFIRRAVSEMRLRLGENLEAEITVSVGISMYPESGDSAMELLRVADRNLYTAKRLGRNRVFLSEPVDSTSSVPAHLPAPLNTAEEEPEQVPAGSFSL